MNIAAFLEVKVIAKAKKAGIVGLEGKILKIKVHSPRDKGKANKELIEILSEFLKVPRSNIQIVKGELSPQKLLCIQGLDEKTLLQKLQGINLELPLM